ncbi:hypothetical protein M404DRAFT_998974, partial [Pisolithus tinctorius Marx 270]
ITKRLFARTGTPFDETPSILSYRHFDLITGRIKSTEVAVKPWIVLAGITTGGPDGNIT